MDTMTTLLAQPGIDRATLERHLNRLTPDRRCWEATELNKDQQIKLWEVAGRQPKPMSLDWLLPPDAKPYRPYPFDGRNSLPAFTRFQKVFYRMEDGRTGGFNNQSLMWFTGPGYYVAEELAERPGEVAVNYNKVPDTKPEGWPTIKANTIFPSRFIYGYMIDYLRIVSDDVCIGRAWRGGKEAPNWFMLVRSDRMR